MVHCDLHKLNRKQNYSSCQHGVVVACRTWNLKSAVYLRPGVTLVGTGEQEDLHGKPWKTLIHPLLNHHYPYQNSHKLEHTIHFQAHLVKGRTTIKYWFFISPIWHGTSGNQQALMAWAWVTCTMDGYSPWFLPFFSEKFVGFIGTPCLTPICAADGQMDCRWCFPKFVSHWTVVM